MKQFIHSTSEIFLMQMVSKFWIDSGAVQTQFLKSSINADGVPSWVNLLFIADGVPSWSVAEHFCNVYEDGVPSWSQHQKLQEEKVGFYKSISQFLTGAMKSWSQHQKLQEEFLFSGNVTIYASD